jgi:hypothetical protein
MRNFMILELSESGDYKHLTALEQRAWEQATDFVSPKPLSQTPVNYRLIVSLSIPLFISGICFGIGITLTFMR